MREQLDVCSFSLADGSTHDFAVYGQYHNPVPYFWSASNYPPATFANDSAALVSTTNFVRRVICAASDVPRFAWSPEPLSRDDVTIFEANCQCPIPFARFRFVFIDDHPQANWHHPCRYVFLSEDLSAFCVRYASLAPRLVSARDGSFIGLDETSVVQAPKSLAAVQNAVYKSLAAENRPSWPFSQWSQDSSHSYFILICGGANPLDNTIRFWNDTAMFYSTLTKRYNVAKDHIQVFLADGTDPAADANLYTPTSPILVSSPTDLDGDGADDITGPAKMSAVKAGFLKLQNSLTSSDRLFVFITSHGNAYGTPGESNYDNVAYLYTDSYTSYWDDEGNKIYFTDTDLTNWTKDIPCTVAFAIESCYSGGFVDNIIASATDTKARAISTSCNHYESSWGYIGYGTWGDDGEGQTFAYNCWIAPLTAAFRGYWPLNLYSYNSYPWQTYYDARATASVFPDFDSRVSFYEATCYAYNNDEFCCTNSTHSADTCSSVCEHPQFSEYPSNTAANFYLVDKVSYAETSLASLSIAGPSDLKSDTAEYACTAFFSDGSECSCSPEWSVLSGAASIDSSGVMTPEQLPTTPSVVIQASCSYNGVTKTATKTTRLPAYVALSTALDNTTLDFATTGVTLWAGETSTTADGCDAAQSRPLADNQTNDLTTVVSGYGTLTFYWFVSSQQEKDFLELLIDGKVVRSISGTSSGWTRVSQPIRGIGSHAVCWRYRKDDSLSSGLDAGFVDMVEWFPDALPDLSSATSAEVKQVLEKASDAKLAEEVVTSAEYDEFRSWASAVKTAAGTVAGVDAVMASPHAWLSFALASDKLMTALPAPSEICVESFEPTEDAARFEFAVSIDGVSVGDSATVENLKKVFGLEGGSLIDNLSPDNVKIEFSAPKDGKVKFTAAANDPSAATFFMRVKVTP